MRKAARLPKARVARDCEAYVQAKLDNLLIGSACAEPPAVFRTAVANLLGQAVPCGSPTTLAASS